MTRTLLVLLSLLLASGCATPTPGSAGSAAGAGAPAPASPSNVSGQLWVTGPGALSLRIDSRRATLVLDGRTREFTVDKNELIFGGRHVIARDGAGAVEVLVAGQACQDPATGSQRPYSARVTLDGGEFIFGCAQDAPRP